MTDSIEILRVVVWPAVVLVVAFRYVGVISRMLPGSKVRVNLAGVEIESTIPVIEQTLTDTFRSGRLTEEQWTWLDRLSKVSRETYDHSHYLVLRPLRNSGLIREYPEGTLTAAKEIEITSLGRLLLAAKNKKNS